MTESTFHLKTFTNEFAEKCANLFNTYVKFDRYMNSLPRT